MNFAARLMDVLWPYAGAANVAQRGAMFGMDARIALIVAAILAAAGGVTLMSRLERSKVDQAEAEVAELRDGLNKYYQNVSINQLPGTLAPLLQSGLITSPNLQNDPWGNPWFYSTASANVELEGTPITVHYAVIYSAGKDGVADSPGLASADDFAGWQPLRDDVGVKYSSRDVETTRRSEFVARAQLIVDKLEAQEAASFVDAQGACSGDAEAPTWCTDLQGKNYTQFNFYPPSSLDETAGAVNYARNVDNKPAYQSGDEADMQQLMLDLGLPANYAKDPWGRILNYHSNITARTDPPFSASVCYSFGEDCFARAR
jgi:type II secretory pathway pseudopilin PulG